MIKSILVGADASAHAEAALEHAVLLGKACKARIMGVNVLDIRYVEMPPYLDYSFAFEAVLPSLPPLDVMDQFRAKGERVLGDLGRRVEAAGLVVDTRMDEGVPGQVISDLAREHDLVVLGKRGEHAKWGRDLLGSTAEAVSKRSTVPVLLVDEKLRPLRRALVLFDDSESAGRGLRLAAELASCCSVALTVLNADDDTRKGQAILDVARGYMESLALEASYLAVPGRPAKAASASLAEEPMDLVVMGMRGHSVIHHLIIGRTAEQLMRSVQIPVLLVP